MNTKQKILTAQQSDLVAELTATYGIDPDEITFFTGDPDPFFGYEATCVLLKELTDIIDRDIEPVASISPDSISRRSRLVFASSGSTSDIGVVNLAETDEDGKELSDQQRESLAKARAIRGAIKAHGVNLMKLHYAAKRGENSQPEVGKTKRERLLAQVHILGKDAGLIAGDDKTIYHKFLRERYAGANDSSDLSDEQLADWAACLRTVTTRTMVTAG